MTEVIIPPVLNESTSTIPSAKATEQPSESENTSNNNDKPLSEEKSSNPWKELDMLTAVVSR